LKSSGVAQRILLDTPFILPSLGISVSELIPEGIKVLGETGMEIYYSRFSILESLWVGTRIEDRTFDPESFQLGLRSIVEGGRYARVEEDSEIFNEAFRVYKLGHKDMIDNILYASAVRVGLVLLTLDEELKKFVSEKKLKYVFISPDELPTLKRLQEQGNYSN
jgi:hypothetical protein